MAASATETQASSIVSANIPLAQPVLPTPKLLDPPIVRHGILIFALVVGGTSAEDERHPFDVQCAQILLLGFIKELRI